MTPPTPAITIPKDLLPADGRFGSGPSKVRPEAVQALADVASTWMGTSHRQAPGGGLVERRSQHLVFGEFSSKFAEATTAAPFLDDPEVVGAEPGSHPGPHATAD